MTLRHRILVRLPVEIALVAIVILGYRWARLLVRDDFREALTNAEAVRQVEERLGLFVEPALQRLVLGVDPLVWFINRYYVYAHFPSAIAATLWLFWFVPRHYPAYRRVMLMVTGTALVLHLAYPLAPPRMLPIHGFVDTISEFGPGVYESEAVRESANLIAAMPSLHVGWAVIVAWSLISAHRTRWRWVVLAHPVITSAAVVLTANHWWIDGAVAGLLVWAAVRLDARWRARRGSPTVDELEGEPIRVHHPDELVDADRR